MPRGVGVDRVVLGSDFPADMGLEDPVSWVEGHGSLTRAEKKAIISENLDGLLSRIPTRIEAHSLTRD